MDPFSITMLGIAAGCLTTFSWLPQVTRCIRTGSARDFSWSYLTMFASGVTLWLVYGIVRNDLAVIAANAVTLALLVAMIWLKGREPAG